MAEGLAMLRTVLETCKLLHIRLVFISSWVVFAGYATDDLCVDETFPLRPKGVYSDSKYLEERLVEAYAQRGEIATSICRLSPLYGPGGDRPRLIKTFHEAITAGKRVRTHRYLNGPPKLDLLYIDDAADAVARIVTHAGNEVFHLGSGKLHSTAEIADMIAKLADHQLNHEEIAIEDHVANVAMDFAKARRLLGWQPRMELRDGLSLCLGLRN
jgi:UDP-glucuronate decarboxylase